MNDDPITKSLAPAVFLVEDDPSMLILVMQRLSARGHRCLQSCPDAAVFIVEPGSGGLPMIDGLVRRSSDPVQLVRAMAESAGSTVVLLTGRGEEMARLRREIPGATMIDRHTRSNRVALTVEAEIARREAA